MHPKVCLALHGSEAVDLGGPSVRVPRTAHLLQNAGIDAKVLWLPEDLLEIQKFNLLHIFNIWPPKSCLSAIGLSKSIGLKAVLSPILLDFSCEAIWNPNQKLPEAGFFGPYPIDKLSAAFNRADHLIFLSEYERELANRIGLPRRPCSIVHNPVNSTASDEDGETFRTYFESRFSRACPQHFLLCVGRIEPRKNQLSLISALAGTNIPLLLAGHETDTAYAAACRKAAESNIVFLGRLPHENGIMLSAYHAAAACAQVTWAEGASLASLEAAAAGCPLILSDLPNNREYFGGLARYADPGDIANIKTHLIAKLQDRNSEDSQRLSEMVSTKFSYDKHVEHLKKIYGRIA
jgi:glycosyltransferase involved in cell wall biosynthesis